MLRIRACVVSVVKHQLCAILVNAGFPEERLSPQSFNFTGPDHNLDVVTVYLCCRQSVNVTHRRVALLMMKSE